MVIGMKGVTFEIVSAKEIWEIIVGVDVEAKDRDVEERCLRKLWQRPWPRGAQSSPAATAAMGARGVCGLAMP
jgi:hypothetical protein